MIRVLQYIPAFDYGGIETFIGNIYKNIDKNKIQFDFLVEIDINKDIANILRKDGAQIYQVPNMTVNVLKYIKAIDNLIKKKNYKIIHCHDSLSRPLLPMIGRLRGVPHIIFHSHSASYGNVKKVFLRRILKNISILFSNHYLACSKEAAEFCFGKRKAKKSIIIKNAIELEKYKYNKEVRKEARKELNIENSFVVGHVGRFCEVKNHNFIIDVFTEVKRKIPDSKLVLVGDGPLFVDIKEKIEKLKLHDDVILTGTRPDVENILQAIDVFIFPSQSEGLGIVGIEAQACGLKVFASEKIPVDMKISNLVEFVSLNKDAEFWAKRIIEAKEYKRKNNYAEIQNSAYNIKKVGKEMQDFYISLI